MSGLQDVLNRLTDEPQHFADCCCALSHPLITCLLGRLPRSPSLVLSIGAGCGLVEEILRGQSEEETVNIYGVEVLRCCNKYLPVERMLRVATVDALHSEAVLAEALLFCYPRSKSLIAAYLHFCARASSALRCALVLSHRSDWPDLAPLLHSAFHTVELVADSGLPEYEFLAVASSPHSQ